MNAAIGAVMNPAIDKAKALSQRSGHGGGDEELCKVNVADCFPKV